MCVVLQRKNVCVFSSSQPQCPCALASLPPPLCASLFTGNAGEPYGWLGWCEATWRLQRAGNLACQAGQHGASRQSIKYSIQHSQFMDLIPQKRPRSKIQRKKKIIISPASQQLAGWVHQIQGVKVSCHWRSNWFWWQSLSGFIFAGWLLDSQPLPSVISTQDLFRVKVQKCITTFLSLGAGIQTQWPHLLSYTSCFWKKYFLTLFLLGCTLLWLLFPVPCIFPEPRGREENIRQSLTVRRVESGRAGPGMSCVSLAQWALIPISITQLHWGRITSTQPLLRQAPSVDRADTVKHQLLSACFAD